MADDYPSNPRPPTMSPVMTFVDRQLQGHKEKLKEINVLEGLKDAGEVLNERQNDLLRSKPSVEALIQEYDKITQPLNAALQEELNLTHCHQPTQVEEELKPTLTQLLKDLVELLYCWFLFDEKSIPEVKDIMAYRKIQRIHCLTHGPDTLNDNDLDYIAMLGGMVAGRPLLSGLSHENAVESCIQHANLWLTKSGKSIKDGAITYAELRELLNKILVSDYFTTTPETMSDYFTTTPKTPLDMDVVARNYVPVLDPSDKDSEFPIWADETTNVGEDGVILWEEDE